MEENGEGHLPNESQGNTFTVVLSVGDSALPHLCDQIFCDHAGDIGFKTSVIFLSYLERCVCT